ncbi:unnamed protein product, partial [Rotaria sp. Silwood1]
MLRCLVQNLTEDAILTRWNVILSLVNGTQEDFNNLNCMDITQKIDAQMLKNVTYKKLLPFMMLS